MSVYLQANRRFVYGNFVAEGEPLYGNVLSRFARVAGGTPEIAIEIVQEYSANQFVGKIYRKNTSGNWVPMDAGSLATHSWYQQFQEQRQLQFDMEGSGSWDVLHFRVESDDTGPYVAVALQYAQQQVAVGQ